MSSGELTLLQEGTPGYVDEEPGPAFVMSVEIPSWLQHCLVGGVDLRAGLLHPCGYGLLASLDLSLLVFRDGLLQDHDGNRTFIGERED